MKILHLITHFSLRLLIYIFLAWGVVKTLYPDNIPESRPHCAMGYTFSILYGEIFLYIGWSIFLLLEASFFTKKRLKRKALYNLILILIPPMFIFLLILFIFI